MQIVRAERAGAQHNSRDPRGTGMVEIVTGFSGTRTSTTKIWNSPFAHFSALASSATTARLRPGSGKGVCVPPGKGGDQLICESNFRLRRIGNIMDGETAIAPGAIAELARDDHVMQRVALALWRRSTRRRRRGSCPAATIFETMTGLVISLRSTMQRQWSVKPSKCAET